MSNCRQSAGCSLAHLGHFGHMVYCLLSLAFFGHGYALVPLLGMVPRPEKDSSLRVGVVSDTHGVADQVCLHTACRAHSGLSCTVHHPVSAAAGNFGCFPSSRGRLDPPCRRCWLSWRACRSTQDLVRCHVIVSVSLIDLLISSERQL